TTLTANEQAELKAIVEKVTAIMPAAGQGLDDYGNYLGLATTKAREFITANQGLEKAIALQSLPTQVEKLSELNEQYNQLVEYRDELNSKGTFRGAKAEDLGTQFLIDFRQELATSATALEKQKQLVAELGGAAGIAAVQFDALAATFPGLAANLAKLGTPFPLANYAGANEALTSQVRILETLKARLKEVQEQRDKETTVKAIKVDNTEIISLQKQIAALEGTDKAGKKATDAITKLRLELSRLTALDNLLGDTPSQMAVLERRSDTLAKGLKTLVADGVSTSSKAFQGFAVDLYNTGIALAKLQAGSGQLNLKPVSVKSLIPQTIGDTLPQDVARLLGEYAKKPIELPLHLEIKPIIDGSIVGSIQDGLLSAVKGIDVTGLGAPLVQYGKDLRNISDLTKAFGSNTSAAFAGFDTAAAKVDAARAALQSLLANGFNPLSPAVRMAAEDVRNYTIASESSRIVTSGLQAGFEALGSAIGESVANGGNVLEAGGKAILAALASIGAKYGAFLIALGIADVATGFGAAKGVLEIAAGVGLIGASAALGAVGGGAASTASGASASTPKASNYGQNSNQTTVKVLAEFHLRGKDFIAFGQQKDYRSKVAG
ncbi:MAG: hypothetical protein ACRYFZ_03655, partial [Janthinobacterium lividum]